MSNDMNNIIRNPHRKYWIIKAFTLTEILIALVVLGTLTVLLFRTYSQMSIVAVRIEQEKIAAAESLLLMQFVQNIADNNVVDFSRYDADLLNENNWFTDQLHVQGEQWMITVQRTGDCLDTTNHERFANEWRTASRQCWLEAYYHADNTTIPLTDPQKVYAGTTLFKVLPIVPHQNIYELPRENIHSYGFWFLSSIYSTQFAPTPWFNVSLPLQSFFTTKTPTSL